MARRFFGLARPLVIVLTVVLLARTATLLAAAMGGDRPGPYPLGRPAACNGFTGLPPSWGQDRHAGMVLVPAGRFSLGSDLGYQDEKPVQVREVRSFHIDRTEVTNAQFAAFVTATAYVTEAERAGGGAVFAIPTSEEVNERENAWWRFVAGASWRSPAGPGSDVVGRDRYPVAMISWRDAQAYAAWLGHRLPTEVEWEYAAKAGATDAELSEVPRQPDGKPAANFWQGVFPYVNNQEDGFSGASPVGCYAANAFGLFDTIGNVWEWTSDLYQGVRQPHGNGDPRPRQEAAAGDAERVIKGGSFLCAEDYCMRYRAAARYAQEADLPTSHVGFRTVADLDPS